MAWYDSIINAIVNSLEATYIKKDNIVNNLTSTDTDKPLSARQGKTLKDSLDEKADNSDIPTVTSDLTNDSGFLTSVPAHTNSAAASIGIATSLVYGHVKAATSTPAAVTTETASVGTDNGLFARADHSHKHPTYTSRSAGLYRITVDGSGHVSAVSAVSITYNNGVLTVSY